MDDQTSGNEATEGREEGSGIRTGVRTEGELKETRMRTRRKGENSDPIKTVRSEAE